MDDIFEDAAEKFLRTHSTVVDTKDLSTQFSPDDVLHFLSLDCARNAMKRVCEVKGEHARRCMLTFGHRYRISNYTGDYRIPIFPRQGA